MKKKIFIAHFPCLDGLMSLCIAAQKYGFADHAEYYGLKHEDPRMMLQNIRFMIKNTNCDTEIIFLDIVPPIEILKILLQEHQGQFFLIDHHLTALVEINEAKTTILAQDIQNKRLHLTLDLKKSAAGLTYDHIFNNDYPLSVSLVQAFDLFSAIQDLRIIRDLNVNGIALSKENEIILKDLANNEHNQDIASHILFFVLASVIDAHIHHILYSENFCVNNALLQKALDFFKRIDKEGVNFLLEEPIFYEMNGKIVMNDPIMHFSNTLTHQRKAIAKGVIIPSLCGEQINVLFINTSIKNGRTFELLLNEALHQYSKPIVAMVTDVTESSLSDMNTVSLRTIDDKLNLFTDIALKYKEKGLVLNAGGHKRASALHFNREQFQKILLLVKEKEKEKEKGKGNKNLVAEH